MTDGKQQPASRPSPLAGKPKSKRNAAAASTGIAQAIGAFERARASAKGPKRKRGRAKAQGLANPDVQSARSAFAFDPTSTIQEQSPDVATVRMDGGGADSPRPGQPEGKQNRKRRTGDKQSGVQQKGNNQKGGGGKGGGPTPPKPAAMARMRKRHWGLVASFVAFVIIPFVTAAWYMFFVAHDQYASTAGFIVRSEEGGAASQLLGGLAQITGGGSAGSDGDILYEFILSQAMVRKIEDTVGLSDHYSARFESDPVFALWPDPSIEDLESHWRRIVRVSYDGGTGLTELRVLAFSPDHAQAIAEAVIEESQRTINALNEQSREDAMRYARADLDEAVERLKAAREALTAFRTRTQIVDPTADIQGRMGVMNNLQQQLAQALIDFDLIQETASPSDPRVAQAQRRIDVIRERIREERTAFAARPSGTDFGISGDYPSLIAEFEGLTVDREFAEETYRAALTALDAARTQAERQSRYLATFVSPTLAESAEFPRRLTLTLLVGFVVLLAWSIMTLIFYAIRDRA